MRFEGTLENLVKIVLQRRSCLSYLLVIRGVVVGTFLEGAALLRQVVGLVMELHLVFHLECLRFRKVNLQRFRWERWLTFLCSSDRPFHSIPMCFDTSVTLYAK